MGVSRRRNGMRKVTTDRGRCGFCMRGCAWQAISGTQLLMMTQTALGGWCLIKFRHRRSHASLQREQFWAM
jgi:hypothetical protein